VDGAASRVYALVGKVLNGEKIRAFARIAKYGNYYLFPRNDTGIVNISDLKDKKILDFARPDNQLKSGGNLFFDCKDMEWQDLFSGKNLCNITLPSRSPKQVSSVKAPVMIRLIRGSRIKKMIPFERTVGIFSLFKRCVTNAHQTGM
jgi:hypothetical protein